MTSRHKLVVTAALATAIAACSPAPATIPPVPGERPAEVITDEVLYSCGDGLTFRAEALGAPAGAEAGAHPAAGALRAHIGGPEAEFLPRAGYRLVAETPDKALFLAEWPAEDAWASVLMEREPSGGWTAIGWGGCEPIRDFGGAGVATWQRDPAAAAGLRPDTTTLRVLVTERACASGQSSEGRIVGPLVTESEGTVILVFGVRPLQTDGLVTCPGNPAVPVIVDLPSPLGDRQLLDGAFLPPRPPAAP